jgi:hypothetical protein
MRFLSVKQPVAIHPEQQIARSTLANAVLIFDKTCIANTAGRVFMPKLRQGAVRDIACSGKLNCRFT